MILSEDNRVNYRNSFARALRELREYGDVWKELANILLEREKVKGLYIESLPRGGKLSPELVDELIKRNNYLRFTECLENGNIILDKEVAKKILDSSNIEFIGAVLLVAIEEGKIRRFDDEVAEMLIDKWYWYYAEELIENHMSLEFSEYSWWKETSWKTPWEAFVGIWVTKKLVGAGYSDLVLKYPRAFWLIKEK